MHHTSTPPRAPAGECGVWSQASRNLARLSLTRHRVAKRDCACSAEDLILYGNGDAVTITTQERPVRFLLVSGQPINEPVAWYGPIVMNTREELRIAFEEYQKGTFIKRR
jgi:redox-sensitive bicupin YhaK (pirin superfamily)